MQDEDNIVFNIYFFHLVHVMKLMMEPNIGLLSIGLSHLLWGKCVKKAFGPLARQIGSSQQASN